MKHLQMTEDLQETAILYAAGALGETERREYARHLDEDNCDACRAEVLEFEAAAQSLAVSLPMQTPSESVKKRLMAQAEALSAMPLPRQERKGSFFALAGWLTAAASVLVLVIVLSSNTTLRSQVDDLKSRVVDLENQIGTQKSLLASLTSPDIRIINLAGQGATPKARARILWDEPAHNWHVRITGLPQAASARSYQMWFVPKTGNPVSARVFNTNPDGSAEMEIAVPAEVTTLMAAAVTDEPAGGRPQPTGGFVLLGNTE